MPLPRHEREARLRRAIEDEGIACRKVVGTSMAPSLLPGETLFLEACPDPAPGDIVAFSVDGGLLVHRIVHIDAETVTCRGDNRSTNDPTVPRSALLGRVVQIAGRDRVPDARRDILTVRARAALYKILRRPWRLAGELWLFAAQVGIGGGPPLRPGAAGSWDREDAERATDHVLMPGEVLAGGKLAVEASESYLIPGAALVVPSGVYGRLPGPARLDLLRSLAGRTVTVWAVPMECAGPLVGLTAALRTFLGRLGVETGQPGDLYVPPILGAQGGFFHVSSADELGATLRAAGGELVTVERRTVNGVRLLRGRATL